MANEVEIELKAWGCHSLIGAVADLVYLKGEPQPDKVTFIVSGTASSDYDIVPDICEFYRHYPECELVIKLDF